MPTIVTADGTQIFYKDWAEGSRSFLTTAPGPRRSHRPSPRCG